MVIPLYRWGAVMLVPFLWFPPASYPAGPAPTKEQLRQFQQLPKAEREAILRSLGGKTREPLDSGSSAVTDVPDSRKSGPDADTVIDPSKAQPPRLKPGDTIVIELRRVQPETGDIPTPDKFSPADRGAPDNIPEQKLFVLDQFGAVAFEKAGRIVLKGLNETEAAQRIAAEPAFKGLQATVKLLPVEEPLKSFGYDLFSGVPRTFAPGTDIPIPVDYIVGPGDTVLVQLFGKENAEHELVITRDGEILFPGIGPISVAGLTFAQLERQVQNRVKKQLIGMKASVTLGRLRSIRVFVLGDAERPGSYIVSGLSTLTNALFTSGGVKRIGSLRDIQLKRKGKTVSSMDLYDLLLRGDNSADARLQSGDVIFIPPIGRTAGIAGRVRRPAIYELKAEKTIGDLIAMAGGLAPDAYLQNVKVERILENRERTLIGVDLAQDQARNTELRDGDIVKIYSSLEQLKGVVKLAGQVQRPGNYPWKPDMRLTHIIPSVSDLQPQADARYLLIKREDALDHTITFLDTDLIADLLLAQLDATASTDPEGTS